MSLVSVVDAAIGVVAFGTAALVGRRPPASRAGAGPGRLAGTTGRGGRIRGRSARTGSAGGRDRAPAATWARWRDLRPLSLTGSGGGHRRRRDPAARVVLGTAGGLRRQVATEPGQSVVVFGPSQSGKTSALAVPAILDWPGPVVAASVKADLLEHTAAYRRSVGPVDVFDPTGTTGLATVGWTPLPSARTWPGARRVAARLTEVARTSTGTMADGDFWYATAARTLAPLLFAAAVGRRTMDDVVRWVATGEEEEILGLLAEAGVPEALDAASSAFTKEPRQRSSVSTTVETVLEPFVDGRPVDQPADPPVTAGPSGTVSGGVDPARLLSGTGTLYLCAPAHDQRRLAPLFASVVHEVVDHVYDRVAAVRRPVEPPLLVVLDEAANLAPLPDLDVLASTAAGHGIVLMTVWHDLAQLTARYGPRATTVVNNHRARLFLPGIADLSTLDYASQLVGEEVVDLPSVTSGPGTSTTTLSPTRRPLAPPAGLRRTRPGEALLVYGSLPPARLRLRTWFDDPRLRRLAAVDDDPAARVPGNPVPPVP